MYNTLTEMALKFLNKKGWHTGSLRNIENVWKAEQKHEAEKRKLEELKKQIHDEREAQEFRLLQEQAGLVPKQERLEFLYDSGLAVGRSATDDYLLGKPVEENKREEDVTKVAAAPGALFVEEKPQSANDAWRKLHTDPLLLIRQQEQAALARIKNNPVKMDLIKRSVQEKIGNKEERKHKDGKKKKHEKRRKKLHADDWCATNKMSTESKVSTNKQDTFKDKLLTSDDCEREGGLSDRTDLPIARGYAHQRNYSSPVRKVDSSQRSHDSPCNSPERRRHDSPERRQDNPTRWKDGCKRRRPDSPERRHDSPERRRDSPERRCDSPKRRHDSSKKRYDSPDTFETMRHKERSREKSEYHKQKLKQQSRNLTEEEKAARLKAMQNDAEVHEEQRWHRLKKASDADRLEEARRFSTSSSRNFVDQTARDIYGAVRGGSGSVEESVRRRTHFIERSLGDSNFNTFQR